MDVRCKQCPLLCKRLFSDDDPERYSFRRLTAQQVITLVDSSINRIASWHCLKIKECKRSLDDQLVVMISLGYRPDEKTNQILLIAQAANVDTKQTYLWFRYGVPESLCGDLATSELSGMICEVLENIGQCDKLLSR